MKGIKNFVTKERDRKKGFELCNPYSRSGIV